VQTITETLTALTLGVGGLLGTNVENIVVVIAAFCGRTPAAALRAGFAAGLGVLLVLSWLSGAAAGLLPTRYLGYLGIVPIAMGLRELWRGPQHAHEATPARVSGGFMRSTGAVAVLMIANGVDTVAVFAPLIAETEAFDRMILTSGFIVAGLALAWLSAHACAHPALAGPIERHGARLAPVVMIGIGIYILLDTATDKLT